MTSTATSAPRTDTQTAEEFYARLPATRGAAAALLFGSNGWILLVERLYDVVWTWGCPAGSSRPTSPR